MTDDISKVGANCKLHGAQYIPGCAYCAKTLPDKSLESITPAEVGEVSAAVADRLEGYSYDASQINRGALHDAATYIRTLARQLAEAKEGEATRKSEVKYWFNAAGAANTRAEQAESHLAAATRRVAEVEGLLREWLDWHDDNSGWIKPPPTEATAIALKKEPI